MCNAYTITHSRDAIIDMTRAMLLKPDNELEDFEPSYRIGIKQHAPILMRKDGRLSWRIALWGLVPNGKNTKRFALNNARADKLNGWPWVTVKYSPCLVPASGFFDPEKPAGSKAIVPWRYYSMASGEPFFMPGLWSEFVNTDTGEVQNSYTIITVDANSAIVEHNRMPGLPSREAAPRWVNEIPLPMDVLTPCPAEQIVSWRVDDRAKNSRTPNNPDLVAPVADQLVRK